MEKFSTYRDEGTGIAPFQQVSVPFGSSTRIANAAQVALGLISFLPALLSLAAYFLVLHWIPFLGQLYLRVIVLRLLRLLYVSFSYNGDRRVAVRRSQRVRAAPGDLIFSNFLSPLDPLVYSAFNSCIFVLPNEDGEFVKVGLFAAMRRALSIEKLSSRPMEISGIVRDARKSGTVVVIFAEATTSNGKGVLPMPADFQACALLDVNIFAAGIKYSPGIATSPVPESLLRYLYRLSTSAWWYMASIKVGEEPLPKSGVTEAGVVRAVASVSRLRQIGSRLDLDAKRRYVAAYQSK